ncbi:MAG: fatty acid hydroxylase family protein [Deltaproteobacteria bacterium]|nr:fatty acid hydroxylase family protein [Deltaproteobacteria bacterium]
MTILERMAASKANYWAGFTLDFVVSLALIVVGVAAEGISLAPVAAFVAGWTTFTFYEYALHRWAYHGPRSPLSMIHGWHHADGTVLLGAPLFFTLGITAIDLVLARLVVAPALAATFAGTVLLAYAYQSIVHHVAHAWPGSWRVRSTSTLGRMRRHHMIHHHGDGDANFGMSTPLWDHVFGTVATRVARR